MKPGEFPLEADTLVVAYRELTAPIVEAIREPAGCVAVLEAKMS